MGVSGAAQKSLPILRKKKAWLNKNRARNALRLRVDVLWCSSKKVLHVHNAVVAEQSPESVRLHGPHAIRPRERLSSAKPPRFDVPDAPPPSSVGPEGQRGAALAETLAGVKTEPTRTDLAETALEEAPAIDPEAPNGPSTQRSRYT